ncbi:hypothetical protein [Oharaeibacter diazotrophicus]|uniref:Uncharacterized protein n=1 Tax=Oharaeibacter diazotrophicus TaxID=1920512 RepID=A0A4R6RDC9_9HYPH|nr:hypothetical protein [Oharaeibacter diazotrophicus]TDP84203.1 hypothetical protein EDD54_2807 [Oharaeibacter diazotrophicus]BBE73241.1 hypothetical protein OHA_1_02850 [Pleomorphomonas sp. SM30]GLS75032.1 hypothetical protein GCM10007904_03670 [Oharaeibacter diazotrophicus]
MTPSELIAALPPGRLPPALLDLGPADLLALFGAGLVLAGLVAAAASPLLARRPSFRARLAATRGLPPAERALALARLLGHLPPALHGVAYRGEPIADAAFERIARAAKRRRR